VITICDHLKNLKYAKALPNAFTEHGAIMVASILNTQRAIQVSVFVVRAFVKLREMLSTHKELAHKLAALERKLQNHDESIRSLVDAIRQLMTPPESKKRPIGFLVEEPKVPYIIKMKRKSQGRMKEELGFEMGCNFLAVSPHSLRLTPCGILRGCPERRGEYLRYALCATRTTSSRAFNMRRTRGVLCRN